MITSTVPITIFLVFKAVLERAAVKSVSPGQAPRRSTAARRFAHAIAECIHLARCEVQ